MRHSLCSLAAVVFLTSWASATLAQETDRGGNGLFQNMISILMGDRDQNSLRATIWVDPDGCEHWVMDDGLEGYMSAHLDRNGNPVCRGADGEGICKTFDQNTMFGSGSAALSGSAREELLAYFKSIPGQTIFVDGHTDSVGPDEVNLRLSLKRAMAVSDIARANGVNAEPRGFGEQVPVGDNATPAGRAMNRRVEINCS